MKGTLYVVSAPSGAGKTSLVKALVNSVNNIRVSISHTTRKPRPGEHNEIDYFFVGQDEFIQMLNKNLFLEHAQVHGHYYGTLQKWMVEQLKAGIDVILEIDWQGAQQVRRLKPDCIGIFVLPPSRAILEERLRARAQDDEEVIQRRMRAAIDEMSHYVEFDYLVVNDNFDKALKELQTIVLSQRLTHRVQAQQLEHLLISLMN